MGRRRMLGKTSQEAGSAFIFSVTVGAGQSFKLPTIASGTYDALVDWGDGNSDIITVYNQSEITHDYTAAGAGTYDITITGTFTGWAVNNYSDRLKITEIKQWGDPLIFSGIGFFFRGCRNMVISATDVPNLGSTTTLRFAFYDCDSIVTIPNSHLWDTSTITSLDNCFALSADFNDPGIGYWDVSNVSNFNSCFSSCPDFNQSLNDWDVSSGTSFANMFNGANSFNQSLNDWDVSSALNMAGMFRTTSFNGNISSWSPSSCTNFSLMFRGATSFNQDIGSWNVSSGTNFNQMFLLCSAFNQYIGDWSMGSATIIQDMFNGASSFNQDLSNWDTSSIESMRTAFRSSAIDQDFGNWYISSVTDAFNMFLNVTLSTANYDSLLISWAAQAPNSGVDFSAGNSQYTSGGAAEAARTTLTTTYSWTISDGGPA